MYSLLSLLLCYYTGEGSAIGSGSSILGFGSDIGGSLRVPAAYCGIYSLKPTAGRLTQRGDVGVDFNERIGKLSFLYLSCSHVSIM